MADTIRTTPQTVVALLDRVTMTAISAVLIQSLAQWHARHRSRVALSHLSDAHLRDVGLDPVIRDTEVNRPFWK